MKRIPIGSRPTNRDELSAWYASVLAEQAKSGQSMSSFAARAGISACSFYQWRRRLPPVMSQRDEQSARLIEVALMQPERSRASRLCVRLRSGHRLEMPSGFNDAELRRLIGVLESC